MLTQTAPHSQGVDFTRSYVQAAQDNIASKKASSFVKVQYGSVYDLSLLKLLTPPSKFDAVYFSGSISLLPDAVKAIETVSKVLKKGGKIYITQTYQKRNVMGLATFKRNLKYLTTIDFGSLVFEADIIKAYSQFDILEHKPIAKSVDNYFQTAYLTIIKNNSKNS